MLLLTASCVLVVLVAVWIRVVPGWPEHSGIRVSAALASIAAPVALLVWLPNGPLAAGWAKRAGTPPSLLARTRRSVARTSPSASAAPAGRSTTAAPAFNAQLTGTMHQSQLAGGLVQVELKLSVSGQSLSALDIRIVGQPLSGGGVAMSTSRVTLGTAADPDLYRGRITGLTGTNVAARVGGDHGSVALTAQLQIDPHTGAVTGVLSARRAENSEGGEP
jgi:hypothetical protein